MDTEVLRRVWDQLGPELMQQGYDLVEVEYGRHGSTGKLRLFIDKEGGVSLADCQAASELVGPLLDMKDFVPGRYVLEVSSPGFDRPLRRPEDFQRFEGERVRLLTHVPVQGRKKFHGVLEGFRDGLIVLECEGVTFEIHIENLKKANLDR